MTVQRIPITDRESWLALRKQDLTASDIGAVAGYDKFASPLKVYAEKTGLIPAGGDNAVMQRGRWFEAAVVEALREKHPKWDIRRAGVYLRDPDIRMGATPDVVAEDPENPGLINIQCKVVEEPIFERDWIDGDAPLKYHLQTLAEGDLMDASRSIIAALVLAPFSAELIEIPVPRHAGAEARIREIVKTFWSNVAAGVRPAVNYKQDSDVVAAMYPESRAGSVIDLSKDNMMPVILAERAELKKKIKDADERCLEIDTEIRAKLGDNEAGELPGWRVSNKAQDRKEYTVAAARFRVLRVTDRREKQGST